MPRSAASAALLVVLAVAPLACRTPTQVTLTITTELPCGPKTPRTLVRVGSLGQLKKPDTVDATVCVDGRVGSLVIVPSGDKSDVVGLEVVTRDNDDPTKCNDAPGADPKEMQGCIIARRALAFVPHSELELPVDLQRACLGKTCDPSHTCVEGVCVDAYIRDSSVCFGDTCRLHAPSGGDAGVDAPPVDAPPDAVSDAADAFDADASAPITPWARAGGSTTAFGGAVAIGSDGSLYAAFSFTGTGTWDRALTAADVDAVLVKYSPSGDVIWSRQIGGDGAEVISYVLVHPSGDVLLIGRTESGVTQPEGGASLASPGGSGLLLARYTAAGGAVLARRFIGGGDYAPYGGAALDASGDLVIAQTVASSVEWDGTSVAGLGDLDFVVARFAAKDLTASKVAVFGGPAGSFTELGGFALGKDGPYLVGQYDATFAGLPAAQKADGFILALDDTFKQRWAFSTVDVGTPDSQQLGAVALTSGGDVFAVGASAAGQVRVAGKDFTGAGALALQFDAAGAFVGGKVFPTGRVVTPGGPLDEPMALALGPGGDLTFAATTLDDVPFTFDSKLAPLSTKGAGDVLLVQLTTSTSGIVATGQRLFGDSASQAVGRLVRAPNGDVVLAGTYAGTLDLGVTPPLGPGGTGRSFLARLKP